jgi:hypothetical protein
MGIVRHRDPPSAALTQLMLEDAANGVDVLGDPPAPPGPAVRIEPLASPAIPPPDWREEELQRAERDAAEEQAELEAPQEHYPAKPTKKSPTPNLDKAREWLGRAAP